MIKISIISSHYGKVTRGAEFWIKSLKEQLGSNFDVSVFPKINDSFRKWISADVVIPIDGRLQVFVTRMLTWVYRKPMVVFGHSGLGADDKWNLLCSPDVFVAFTSFQKRWAEKFKLSWTKVMLIPHAVDIDRFTPAKKKPNRNIVLCVAANTPSKRINIVSSAIETIPNTTFKAVGKGNPIEASFDEMPQVYKNADVFVFTPNIWEAFGLVFLEAMASNLPVVTTNDPIRREIVGNAGIFVNNPEDRMELASAIKATLNKNWGSIPRKRAENFSWDKIRIKYEELFKNLVLEKQK